MHIEKSLTEFTLPIGRKAQAEPFPPVLASAVRSALDRVLRSPDFRASKRNRKFLQRVVEAELDGLGHEINGYVIGSEVFGRGKSFDHVKDPIVRIEATKIRRDLERYYLTAGRGEHIIIAIPKGAYRPVFETRDENAVVNEPPAGRALDPSGVTVASLRLGDSPLSSMQPPLRAQLADALTRDGNVAVYVSAEKDVALLDSETVRLAARSNGTALVLSGDTWSDGGEHRIVVRLHDGTTGQLVWSEEFPQDAASIVSLLTRRIIEARKSLAGSGATGEAN